MKKPESIIIYASAVSSPDKSGKIIENPINGTQGQAISGSGVGSFISVVYVDSFVGEVYVKGWMTEYTKAAIKAFPDLYLKWLKKDETEDKVA